MGEFVNHLSTGSVALLSTLLLASGCVGDDGASSAGAPGSASSSSPSGSRNGASSPPSATLTPPAHAKVVTTCANVATMPVSGLLCAQAQYVVRKCALNPPLTLISRSVDLSGWTDPKSGRPAYAGFAYRGLGRDDVPVVLSCGRPSNKIDIPTMLSDVRSAAASGWRTEVGRIGCYSREHRRGVVDQLPAGPYQISCAVLTTYTTESGGSVEAGSPAWIDITRRHPYYRIILGE